MHGSVCTGMDQAKLWEPGKRPMRQEHGLADLRAEGTGRMQLSKWRLLGARGQHCAYVAPELLASGYQRAGPILR